MSDAILFFDTETTGLPLFKKPLDHASQPKLLQLGAILATSPDDIIAEVYTLVQIGSTPIHPMALKAHGISAHEANLNGRDPWEVFEKFHELAMDSDCLVCHNHNFDFKLLEITAAQLTKSMEDDEPDLMLDEIKDLPYYCTMVQAKEFCALPFKGGRKGFKFPKLSELHQILFGTDFDNAHSAEADVKATMRCFFELKARGIM